MMSFNRMQRSLVGATFLATAAFLSQAADAAVVSCTITGNQTTTYSLPTGGTASPGGLAGDCFDGGPGQINVTSNDAFLERIPDNGYVGIVKLDPGQTSLNFQATGNGSWGTSGTWTISAALLSLYDSFAIGLKAGNTWAVILTSGLTGTWATDRNLSHINLYGIGDGRPNEVPLPGALVLMGTVLAGGAGFGAMRKRAKKAVSLQAA